MNAAGRLETAQYALDMLTADDPMEALRLARHLDEMNQNRRREQDEILKEALVQAEELSADPVLVVSSPGWNHGIVGIVAAKLLERYQKPTFVLSEHGEETKGSARSYGDFSAADAIRFADDIITKGGGHKLAAGVTMPTANVAAFRKRVNEFYIQQKLRNQAALLLPSADSDATLDEVDEALIDALAALEPFGSGNPQPILRTESLTVYGVRRMGDSGQHVKLTLKNQTGSIDLIAFNAPEHFFVDQGTAIVAWYVPELNEWQGRRSVEGRLLHLELVN
jgi:single-stranded-DNA-specific exonuclease